MHQWMLNRHAVAAAAIAVTLVTAPGLIWADESNKDVDGPPRKPYDVVQGAVGILRAQMNKPPSDRVPLTLRHAAKCVAVFPNVMKAGLLIAGKRGPGLVSCRHADTQEWGAPAHYNMTELSIGLQAGVQAASFLLLVVDDAGVERLLGEKMSFGGDISVAAGPVGAGKQVNIDSSVVSYAHAEGVFAGVQLGGSAITFDKKANAESYGTELSAKRLLLRHRETPELLKPFQVTLGRYAPAKK